MAESTDEQRARYRQRLCVACGERDHGAGRTRCNECHRAWSRGGELLNNEEVAV